MKKYGAVITTIFILTIFMLTATFCKSDYEIERTVIDLPDYEIQPVRSFGEYVGDEVML